MLRKFTKVLEEWRYTPSAEEREKFDFPRATFGY